MMHGAKAVDTRPDVARIEGPVMLFVSSLVVLWSRYPGLLPPRLPTPAFALLVARDASILDAHACVLCAYVSPRVDLYVGVCTWVWWVTPDLLPTGRLCFAAYKDGGRPSFTAWVSTSAGLIVSPRCVSQHVLSV